jgi:tetratricopeptide (TPR) repeat protein
MASTIKPRLIDAFHPDVLAFRNASFALAEDLDWLDRQRGLGAPEAVVLYCTRILEVLVREALTRSQVFQAGDKLALNLDQLLRCNLLARPTYNWLHRLRDLGNRARHALAKVTPDDADAGYVILLRGLQWFFCELTRGPRLKGLTIHNQPLDMLLPSAFTSLLVRLETAALDDQNFLDALRLDKDDSLVLLSPVVAAVLAEVLVGRGHHVQVQEVLTKALARFPADVRLRQLQGLVWSRTGRLDEARAMLEAIDTLDSTADEETQGILAGVYKRLAESHPSEAGVWLMRCHETYRKGWNRSERTNAYLGINAAATALWLDLPGRARAVAEEVRDLMEDRRKCFQACDPPRLMNYWDQVTLAEAYLLLKEFDLARQYYHAAVQRFPEQIDDVRVSRDQVKKHLTFLGRPDLLDDFFPGGAP